MDDADEMLVSSAGGADSRREDEMSITGKSTSRSFLFIWMALLLVLMQPRQALAIPASPNQSIVLDSSAGSPGSQIVVQGSGSTGWDGGGIDLHWDNMHSPLVGSGPSVDPDG